MKSKHPKRKPGRRPLPPGLRRKAVNVTLPLDVRKFLETWRDGIGISPNIEHLARVEMARQGKLPPLASYPGYDPDE